MVGTMSTWVPTVWLTAPNFSGSPGDQQQRHVEAAQVQLGDLLLVAEAMVADDDEQGVLEVRLLARLLEELAKCPVGIAHGREVFVQAALACDLLDRQVLGQRIRGVVGERLQQRVDRLLPSCLANSSLPRSNMSGRTRPTSGRRTPDRRNRYGQ